MRGRVAAGVTAECSSLLLQRQNAVAVSCCFRQVRVEPAMPLVERTMEISTVDALRNALIEVRVCMHACPHAHTCTHTRRSPNWRASATSCFHSHCFDPSELLQTAPALQSPVLTRKLN